MIQQFLVGLALLMAPESLDAGRVSEYGSSAVTELPTEKPGWWQRLSGRHRDPCRDAPVAPGPGRRKTPPTPLTRLIREWIGGSAVTEPVQASDHEVAFELAQQTPSLSAQQGARVRYASRRENEGGGEPRLIKSEIPMAGQHAEKADHARAGSKAARRDAPLILTLVPTPEPEVRAVFASEVLEQISAPVKESEHSSMDRNNMATTSPVPSPPTAIAPVGEPSTPVRQADEAAQIASTGQADSAPDEGSPGDVVMGEHARGVEVADRSERSPPIDPAFASVAAAYEPVATDPPTPGVIQTELAASSLVKSRAQTRPEGGSDQAVAQRPVQPQLAAMLNPYLPVQLKGLPLECHLAVGFVVLALVWLLISGRTPNPVSGQSFMAAPGISGVALIQAPLGLPQVGKQTSHCGLFGLVVVTIGLALMAVGGTAVFRAYFHGQVSLIRPGLLIAAIGQFVMLFGIIALAVSRAWRSDPATQLPLAGAATPVNAGQHGPTAVVPITNGSGWPLALPVTANPAQHSGQIAQPKAQLTCLAQQLDQLETPK